MSVIDIARWLWCIIIQENHMTMTLVKKQSQPKTRAISESSKLQAIPREVAPHTQPITVLFNRAIQLWVCNSVYVTCTAIVFQAVLNISVTHNPLIRAHRPKAPKNCNPPLNANPENFRPPQMAAQKIADLPKNLPALFTPPPPTPHHHHPP